jgi:DNA repair protein RecN (Recombination protein N)
MLRSLHIRNYILIDSLEVQFPEGLVIITGQTGAGKSILLGALSLVAGAKGDASVLSEGAENCVVEAEFDTQDEEIRALLEENDAEWDDGHLIVRRVVNRSGRSRSFVNDCPVPVTLLPDIASRLIDIHSQHRSLLLTDRGFQLSALDWFAGNAATLQSCRAAWKDYCGLRDELEKARTTLARLASDRDYNQAQWEQLDAARLREGELEELDAEQKQLANAEQIKESLSGVQALMDADERSGREGMDASLKEASRLLGHVARYVPSLSSLSERVDSARIELADILSEVEDINSRTSLSQERLEQVEDRMSLLYSLMKKHGCRTVEELIAVRDGFSDALYDSTALEERIQELEKQMKTVRGGYEALCSELHASRVKAAPEFADRITASLHFLELDRAVFDVTVSDAQEGPSGTDRVQFLFSSTGSGLQDVSKVASGGEISRIMLCLKAMMARYVGMPTLIFDEIDSGVSGSVADKMGRMICDMGKDMQVFSITHLPQVAAKGDAHYVVSKSEDASGRTVSTISEVRGEERIMEIARLLSGSRVTPEAVANARSLMDD